MNCSLFSQAQSYVTEDCITWQALVNEYQIIFHCINSGHLISASMNCSWLYYGARFGVQLAYLKMTWEVSVLHTNVTSKCCT